ncbi:hypothetical protein NPIL_233131 [Nephila pilipes]|uniref:RNase H type-1 domain-containing protein n=1 Tax=Nephila pilipes TaxID=299642 RepID=A0A8X6Q8J9_NEPPI|nr:hypothetical protein NPIL_233131 [Nephila pilipes]
MGKMREKYKTIVLQWIPSNCGISGNEKGDGLAKKGCLVNQTPYNMFCTKVVGCGRNVAEIAAYLGTCVYNDKQSSLVSVAKKLDLLINKKMKMHFQILDKLRIKKAEKHVSEQSHEARKTKRLKVIKDNENMRMKEGDVYVPGGF